MEWDAALHRKFVTAAAREGRASGEAMASPANGDEANDEVATGAADGAAARSVIGAAAAGLVVMRSLRDEPTPFPEHLCTRRRRSYDDASVIINWREYMNS